MTRGVVAVGVVLASGLAGWGGSMIALAADDGTPAAAESTGPVQAAPTGGPVTSAPTSSAGPSSAATTRPDAAPTTAPPPAAAGDTGPSTSGSGGAASPIPDAPVRAAGSPEPPRHQGRPDIVFVSPYSFDEDGDGPWTYQVGLLGFPADTVVEISGFDDHGNRRVAALALTTADGSVDPYSPVMGTAFAYGGTCDAAKPATVTARGSGFSVTETAPRPLECDGGTTSSGPWQRPVYPVPAPTTAPRMGDAGER